MFIEIHTRVAIQNIAKAMQAHNDYATFKDTISEKAYALHRSTVKLASDRVLALIKAAKGIFDVQAHVDFLSEYLAKLGDERARLAKVHAARKLAQFA